MSTRQFDLNIEKILENWEPYDAVREVIANAIDEQILSQTKEIQIGKTGNTWIIRDFGRGIKYEHLTQNENEEKLRNEKVIGKFGIGLKDALATFDRHGIDVLIRSRFGDIRILKTSKAGFDDIVTLHAEISKPSDSRLIGTEVILKNIADREIEKAKKLFLMFSGDAILESTSFGDLIENNSPAKIYINGVRVATEPNFLFSYNITALNSSIKNALNRERTNVGRTAYSSRVKQILLDCKSKNVAQKMVDDLKNYTHGSQHDEMNWIDIQQHAMKILSAGEKVVSITTEELITRKDVVDRAKDLGYNVITIPTNLREKIRGQEDIKGRPIVDLNEFNRIDRSSFSFKFVNPRDLTKQEKSIFDQTNQILSLIGGKPSLVKEIVISENMRKDFLSYEDTLGLWEPSERRIVILRNQLQNLESYAGTLLHEVAHVESGASDVSRSFEKELTSFLGKITKKSLENTENKKKRLGLF